jgi:chaperone required for assembly of F1-ATPase
MREMFENIETDAVRDPMRVAALSMKPKLPKRFYKTVEAQKEENGFCVLLDGKPVKTPARKTVLVAKQAAARLLVDEWSTQQEHIDPATMPVTRLVNTAIDGVSVDMQAVKEDIIRFAGSDLLCYRVESPQGLLQQQRIYWDPLIDWAQSALNARFVLTEGIVHVAQSAEAMAAFGTHVGMIDQPDQLASIHSLTSLTGSAIIAMALFKGGADPKDAWSAACVDEDWQLSQWGEDSEALALREARKREFDAAVNLLKCLNMA